MLKTINLIQKYIILITTAILPVFVILNSTAPVIVSKIQLIAVASTLFLAIWAMEMFITKKVSFSIGKFDLGVFFFGLVFLLAGIFKTPNKMEAFFLPGIATFALISTIFYFLVNQVGSEGKNQIKISMLISGLLLSLTLVFAQIGVFGKISGLPVVFKDSLFNPMGGAIPAGIFLIPLVFLGISLIIKEKDNIKRILWGIVTAIIIMALVILIGNALPGKSQFPKLPSLQVSWEVAVQTISKSPIFGIGPGNYLSAFNQFKPISYNGTDLWNTRFATANNFYLTLVTEAGLLGLITIAAIIFAIYKVVLNKFEFEHLALVSILILFAVLPASPILFIPFFVFLSLFSNSESKVEHVNSKVLSTVFGFLILAGLSAVNFFGFKIVKAEATFTKALTALNKNDGKETYNLMISAVNFNPRVDRYHAFLSQVEMAIANSIATKENIDEKDKTSISQLIQQSIEQGKAAVTLNQGRSGNWEVLAQTYRSVMPYASGADNFAIQTYSKAIELDPINPNLRIELGGVYFALGRYDEAIDTFKLAVLAKPDLANSYYNLAIAYREKKDYEKAIVEMKQVISLVEINSEDYKLAAKELESLEKNKSAKSTEGSENLNPPTTAEEPIITPPLELPEEANPPTE